MGRSSDYPNVPDWTPKPEGYQTGATLKYGNVFQAAFGAGRSGAWPFRDSPVRFPLSPGVGVLP